jgi:hypothetical protein
MLTDDASVAQLRAQIVAEVRAELRSECLAKFEAAAHELKIMFRAEMERHRTEIEVHRTREGADDPQTSCDVLDFLEEHSPVKAAPHHDRERRRMALPAPPPPPPTQAVPQAEPEFVDVAVEKAGVDEAAVENNNPVKNADAANNRTSTLRRFSDVIALDEGDVEAEVEIERSMWDMSLLIGTASVPGAASAFLLILLVFNVLVQCLFCYIVWEGLAKPEYTGETVAGFRTWRRNVAHDIT